MVVGDEMKKSRHSRDVFEAELMGYVDRLHLSGHEEEGI